MSKESTRPEKQPLHRRASGFLRWLPWKVGYRWGPPLMSELRKRWVLLRHPNATIRFGRGVYLGPGFSLDIRDGGTFIAGDRVEFRRGFRAEIAGDGRIVIGAGSYCTYDVLLQCSTSLEIGERVGLGQSVIVLDGNHRFRDITKPILAQGYDLHPVRIGNDAFVPSKCTVLADIGERAMIGANSVVTRPVPAYTVAVGSPAKPIDYFGPPGEEPEELRPAPSPSADL